MTDPNNIRCAQLMDTYFPIVDGVVSTVHQYATHINKKSYSCVIVPKGRGGFDDSSLPYDVIRTRDVNILGWNYTCATPKNDRELNEKIPKMNLDILHSHSPFVMGPYAAEVGKRLGIPVISTFHTKYYDDALRVTHSKTLAKVFVNRIVEFYNSVDSVWSCSEATAETLRSYGYKGDIFVMNNGTDVVIPKDGEAQKKKAAEQFGIDSSRKNLLFVGHLIWLKNLRLILETMQAICKDHDDYTIIFVGDGHNPADVTAVKTLASKLGLTQEQVIFTGKVMDRELLSGLYMNADLFFFPSLYDNAPLTVREAAANAVPSLLVEGTNAAEVVKDGVNGYTAANDVQAMKEKILKIFADDEARKAAGIKARETIPIPWEKIVGQVLDKYAEIIDKKKFENKL